MTATEGGGQDLLTGVRVLDFSQFYAGPVSGRILAEMGAEVILLEQAGRIDPTRQMTTIGGVDFSTPQGRNLLFDGVSRGKKSICIDLKTDRGRQAVYRLVKSSDVFHTNYRSSTLSDAGLDYPTLSQINPRLIYSRVSGFGPKGPLKDERAFDFAIQGFSGMMSAMGNEDGDLAPPLILSVDQTTGMLGAYSIVAALLHRERTGFGQEVHTSLLGTAVQMLYFHFLSVFHGNKLEKHSRIQPGNALRNYYRCGDGQWLICAHNPKERYWRSFSEALGLKDAPSEEGLRGAGGDSELTQILDKVFATKPRGEWLKLGQQHGLVFVPVNSVQEAAAQEQVLANYAEDEVTVEGRTRSPGFCTHFAKTPVRGRGKAPELGEHTEEVLRTVAGYSEAEVRALKEEGVIRTSG